MNTFLTKYLWNNSSNWCQCCVCTSGMFRKAREKVWYVDQQENGQARFGYNKDGGKQAGRRRKVVNVETKEGRSGVMGSWGWIVGFIAVIVITFVVGVYFVKNQSFLQNTNKLELSVFCFRKYFLDLCEN